MHREITNFMDLAIDKLTCLDYYPYLAIPLLDLLLVGLVCNSYFVLLIFNHFFNENVNYVMTNWFFFGRIIGSGLS